MSRRTLLFAARVAKRPTNLIGRVMEAGLLSVMRPQRASLWLRGAQESR